MQQTCFKRQYNKLKAKTMIQSLSMAGSIEQQSEFRSISHQHKNYRINPITIKPLHHKPRSPHAIDIKSEKYANRKYLPYIPKNRKKYSYMSEKEKSKEKSKSPHNHSNNIQQSRISKNRGAYRRKLLEKHQTYVERYQQRKQAVTVLSIRFASENEEENVSNKQQAYYKATNQEQNQPLENNDKEQNRLPYLRYKKSINPEEQLQEMGYNSDTRLASEIYSEKVEEKKAKYVNKMEALKKKLQSYGGSPDGHTNHLDIRRQRIEKSRIQVKLLGEQIRRNRQRELIKVQELKGRKMLEQLLRDKN